MDLEYCWNFQHSPLSVTASVASEIGIGWSLSWYQSLLTTSWICQRKTCLRSNFLPVAVSFFSHPITQFSFRPLTFAPHIPDMAFSKTEMCRVSKFNFRSSSVLSGMTGYISTSRGRLKWRQQGGRLPVYSYFTTRRAYFLRKAFRKGFW